MASKKNRAESKPKADDALENPARHSRRGGRETADALVVAFVLAFLIRTFTAEAFVIPTGSMAPTLMGQHKDVYCDQCGTRFKVNASDERPDVLNQLRATGRLQRMTRSQVEETLAAYDCLGGECPQCRYLMLLNDEGAHGLKPDWVGDIDQTANYSGDRLVVSKFAYSFSDPERWDVAVFKYPGNSQTNYIKRVTGLPGEEIRVFQGDLFVRPLDSEEPFQIARKPPKQAMAMRQFVHDTDHEAAALVNAGWPLAWSGDEGWEVSQSEATPARKARVVRPEYRVDSPAGQTRWLRYRHRPPTENAWRRVLGDGESITAAPEPSLVTDFTPYNTQLKRNHAVVNARRQGALSLAPLGEEHLGRLGLHWVGDLMLEADLVVESGAGEVTLDLVEAGDHYGVTFDLASGEATLWRRAFEALERETLATAATSVRGAGEHAVRLSNFDSRLLLWVDGALVDADASYQTPGADAEGPAQVPRSSDADEGDLAPAGVGASGARVVVKRLRLWRDGYYIATNHRLQKSSFTTDLPREAFQEEDRRRMEQVWLDVPRDPRLWYALAKRRRVDFPVREGQLFVMGDNSGWSLDARLWAGGNGRDGGQPGGPYLERSQLVGKAICVYWPHAWYSVPGTGQKVPAWPNFNDMRLVR